MMLSTFDPPSLSLETQAAQAQGPPTKTPQKRAKAKAALPFPHRFWRLRCSEESRVLGALAAQIHFGWGVAPWNLNSLNSLAAS